MYLHNALILGSGALEDLELDFDFTSDGLPKPMVIVGKNGSGKSNFLSFVTDALIEIAAKHFTDVAPSQGFGHKWHRIIGGGTIRNGCSFELAAMKFAAKNKDFTYVSKGGNLAKKDVSERLQRFGKIRNWGEDEAIKYVSGPQDIVEEIFRDGCYASFPSGRFETPYWTSMSSKSDEASFDEPFSNTLGKPISVHSTISELKPWLVNTLLDSFMNPHDAAVDKQKFIEQIPVHLDPRTQINNFNAVIQTILNREDLRIKRVQFDGTRKLSIAAGDEVVLISLESLSSGQAMLLSIFGTILRYAERPQLIWPTEEIEGIVLVDEIDTHLHADLLHDVLPKLMKMFPRVQFIVSAHAPLFPLGMEKMFGEHGFSLIEFPHGRKISAERFSEFEASFQYLQETKSFDEAVSKKARSQTRPLILCEGETDPKYLKTAAKELGFDQLLEAADFDWIGIMSNGQAKDGGEGQLWQAVKTLRNNPGLLKAHTVLLFDCDQKGKREEFDEDLIHVRVLTQNEENDFCESGIENLLPKEVFTEDFVKEETHGTGIKAVTKKVLDKTSMCNHLCEEVPNAGIFERFRPELERIQAALFPQQAEQPA